jgi:hypothetical protein
VTRRCKIKPGDCISFKFTREERDAVLEHTFADPSLTDRLKIAEATAGGLLACYTIDEMDELLGFIAAEANHTNDKKLGKLLDRLFSRLKVKMEAHDDGLWQGYE